MLLLHLGMRIRLLEHMDLDTGLVKDAEGEVVHITINPEDEDEVREARDARPEQPFQLVPFSSSRIRATSSKAPTAPRRHDAWENPV